MPSRQSPTRPVTQASTEPGTVHRWRTASGLRAGIPSPWRANALRSDGQVVPSGIHAAELLGRREAAFGLGAVPRNRLGCQPNPWRGHTAAAPMDRLLDTEA